MSFSVRRPRMAILVERALDLPGLLFRRSHTVHISVPAAPGWGRARRSRTRHSGNIRDGGGHEDGVVSCRSQHGREPALEVHGWSRKWAADRAGGACDAWISARCDIVVVASSTSPASRQRLGDFVAGGAGEDVPQSRTASMGSRVLPAVTRKRREYTQAILSERNAVDAGHGSGENSRHDHGYRPCPLASEARPGGTGTRAAIRRPARPGRQRAGWRRSSRRWTWG